MQLLTYIALCETKITTKLLFCLEKFVFIYNRITYKPRHEKTGFCLHENKGADQLRSNCEADERLCFRYMDSTILSLLTPKILSFLLCVYKPFIVSDLVRNPEDRFSQVAAQILSDQCIF